MAIIPNITEIKSRI